MVALIPPRRRIWTPDHPNPNVPDKTTWFQPSNDTLRQQEEILANCFFLVRQGDTFGERLKCDNCGGRHNYITMKCINKPITGLANGLYAYYRIISDYHLEKELSEAQLGRFRQIHTALGSMPDLGSVHPQLARQLVKDVGPKDMQMGALALGVLEPISPTEARRLAEKINEKGVYPRFKLGVVSKAESDRMMEYQPRSVRGRW